MTDHLPRRSKTPLWVQIMLGILGAGILIAILVRVPQLEIPHSIHDPEKRQTIENAARTTLAAIVGGFAVFVTAWQTIRNIRISEQNLGVGQDNLRVAQKNLEIAEAKAVTDRFSKAVEQLSSEKIAVRLGGIYSLERLAKDSPDDYPTIMEVLCAFVRQQLPKVSLPLDDFDLDYVVLQDKVDTAPTDVQAAITVIGRSRRPQNATDIYLDLTCADLRGVDFKAAGLHFHKIDFALSILCVRGMFETDFSYSRFNGALITPGKAENVNFNNTIWNYTTIAWGCFENCTFKNSQFRNFIFANTDFTRCDFSNSCFERSVSNDVNCQECDFLKVENINVGLHNWELVDCLNINTIYNKDK